MIPVVTPEEMAAIDQAAVEPVEVLIERAGAAVALAARRLLGGTYGRRVVVVAGKGNNGADGRSAAARLRRWGVRVSVIDALDAPDRLLPADLVIDAAYGTGFHGEYQAPSAGGARVLAVDIPSGVDGLTGAVHGRPLVAAETVTFAALKPGLLFPPGSGITGEVVLADIGLDTSSASVHVVEASDAADWLPRRAADTHKWKAAVWIAAGSRGMTGAAHLAAEAALRTGAGMVRVGSPGAAGHGSLPVEAVGVGLPEAGWDVDVLEQLHRFGALVIGPGLGRAAPTVDAIRSVVTAAPVPLVVDGDGLTALGPTAEVVLRGRAAATVLTPHDGEFAALTGHAPTADRIAAARDLASHTGAIVLLKGAATVIAAPDGRARISRAGDARLATAGSGDVLSGIIGALLGAGVDAFDAATGGAFVHGRAGTSGHARGVIASDLVAALPAILDELAR